MVKRNGMLSIHDTSINVWEEQVNEEDMMRQVYSPLIRFLRTRGFLIRRDPYIMKHFRILSQRHHAGRIDDLEVKVELSGRCLKVEFFQNLNFENSNGGQYDFDKFKKMPYLMQKRFALEASAIMAHLSSHHRYSLSKNVIGISPFDIISSIRGFSRAQEPLRGFNDTWGADRFERDETGWPVSSSYDHGYNKDREGIPLRNGMQRWFRGRDGYLRFGIIYTNMNEMWQIVYGPGRNDTTWASGRELFSLQPEDCRRRYFHKETRERKLSVALEKAVKEMSYERAAAMREALYGSREQALEGKRGKAA